MKYVVYDPVVGTIIQWGDGEPPIGSTYLEHNIEGSLADYCVIDGEVVVKPQMSLTVPTAPTAADGVAEAVIAGLPAGTVAAFTLSGNRHSLVVEDGSLELSLFDPGTVAIRFWHPTAQHDPVEVTFV